MEEESEQDKESSESNIRKSLAFPMTENGPLTSGETQTSATNYDKLCLSLLCGLPNEQELALNVCSILSNERNFMLQLEHAPKLVDLLIAQTGVWRTGDDSLKLLYLESWKDLKGRNMCQFWKSVLDLKNDRLLQLLGYGEFDIDEDFFNLETDSRLWNIEGQRVLRVALILHNLSFEKNNVPVLVASSTFLRFLLLSINSSWSNLKQTAYDTLSNVAHLIKLSIEKDVCSRLIFQAVSDGIQSSDRYMVIRSMDILSQLCNGYLNEDVIPSRLDLEVYGQMVSFLTVHDIMLLFYTLEALYALSDLGRYPCDRISSIHGSIGSLVSLLTLDPSQYGISAEIRMKIVETLVPAEYTEEQEKEAESANPPEPIVAKTTTPSTPSVNSETFASNWLKSTYEVSPGNTASRNDVYADYVNFCTKAGCKSVLNANLFSNCVKNSFPQSGLKKFISVNGAVTFHHDGIKRKNVVTSLGVPPVPKKINTVQKSTPTTSAISCKPLSKPIQSPILKAQLSAPTSTPSPPILKTCSQNSEKVSAPITTSPSVNPSVTSSTLIKSLLANKVQQRNLQQKMVIYSPGKITPNIVGSPTTIVRCIRPQVNNHIRPSLQARIIPNKGCLFTTSNPGVIKANPMWSPKGQVVKQAIITTTPASTTLMNGVQDTVKVKVPPEEVKPNIEIMRKQASSVISESQSFGENLLDSKISVISGEDVNNLSKQNILISSAQENTMAYKLAAPSEIPSSSGNFFIVRSQPSIVTSSRDTPILIQHEGALVNGSDMTSNLPVTPLIVSSPSNIFNSISNDTPCIDPAKRESICKKAPLLNGLLDKGKLPLLEEFQSKVLLHNGSNEGNKSFLSKQLSLNQESSPVVTNSLVTISSNSISQGIFTVSSAYTHSLVSLSSNTALPASSTNSLSLNSSVIPSLNSIIMPTSSTIMLSSRNSTTATNTAPVLVPSILPATSFHSNGTDLMQICTGQTSFSGTVEVQPDQKGVVRLHIESPENSNQGSDLSSISDIARTLECASQAISRTNAECNTQVPCSSACVAPQTVTVINTNTPNLARTAQQIIVVTPVLNQPQLQLQSPNIKLCILQSIPKTDNSVDLVTLPQINVNQLRQPSTDSFPVSATTLKRPSSDNLCNALKKSRIESKSPLLEASLCLPSLGTDAKHHENLPILIKSSSLENLAPTSKPTTMISTQNADLPNESESKTFSGLSSASDNPSLVTTTQTTPKSAAAKLEFICEWKDCGLKFSNPGLVFLHASKTHVPLCNEACQWEGCDSMKRRPFSLLTHLQDWHCNERVLHAQAVRRIQLSQQGKSSIPPPQKPPPHPGYTADAAMLAIKRHALQYINPKELSEEKESALTKSIRLTSALILRNLVTHSSIARTYVRRFEPELAYLAMSPVESARTIAQCLSELSRTHD